jgi:DNA-binding GntR family transcriptional regulator
LEYDDLSHRSFQETLEQQYHAVVAKTDETFEMVMGTVEDWSILGLPSHSRVLIIQRLSFSVNQIPLVWADIHIRTDRYDYVKNLWPEAASLLNEG